MATITIKIDSADLAREVLTHLGYLPEDDVPDLISVEDPVEEEEPVTEPPKEPVTAVRHPGAPPTVSSRDAHVEQTLKKLLVTEGLVEAEPADEIIPEPDDEGFGTPLDQSGVEPFETVKPGVVQNPELWQRHYDQRLSQPVDDAATQEAKLKREEKEKMQLQLRARMQKVKDTNTVEEYKAELKRLMHSEDKDIKEVADDLLGDMDPDYIKYIEEKNI